MQQLNHIDCLKIITFFTYVLEEPSVFYINKENKSAIFKFGILLSKIECNYFTQGEHYLIGKGYSERNTISEGLMSLLRGYMP